MNSKIQNPRNLSLRLAIIAIFCAAILDAVCVRAGVGTRQTNSHPVASSGSTNATPPLLNTNKVPKTGLKRQVNAGSRSGNHERVVLAVIAPEGLGLCSQNQPTFWWYISEQTTNRVEFTVNQGFKTLVNVQLPAPIIRGWNRIELAQITLEHPIKLDAGKPYEWTVRLRKGDDPATQPVSIGWVQWVPLEPELRQKIASSPNSQHAPLYGSEGYWYDTIDSAALELQNNSHDTVAHSQMMSLLSQAGLKDINLFEEELQPE